MPEDSDHTLNPEDENSGGFHRRAFFRHLLGQDEEEPAEPVPEDPLPDAPAEEEEPVEEKPVDRRNFFQETFRSVMRPAVEYLEYRLKPVLPEEDNRPPRYLRPPGADFEHIFVGKCERSGRCGEVCPVQAIRFMQSDDQSRQGRPYIHASTPAGRVGDAP